MFFFFLGGPSFGPHQGCCKQHSIKGTKLSTTFNHFHSHWSSKVHIFFFKSSNVPYILSWVSHLFISLHLLFKPCFESAHCLSIFNNAHVMLQTFFFVFMFLLFLCSCITCFEHTMVFSSTWQYILHNTHNIFFSPLLFILDVFFSCLYFSHNFVLHGVHNNPICVHSSISMFLFLLLSFACFFSKSLIYVSFSFLIFV